MIDTSKHELGGRVTICPPRPFLAIDEETLAMVRRAMAKVVTDHLVPRIIRQVMAEQRRTMSRRAYRRLRGRIKAARRQDRTP